MARRSFSKAGVKAKPATFFVVVGIILIGLLLSIFGLTVPIPGQKTNMDVEAVFAAKNYTGIPTEAELNAARSVIELRLDKKNILDREVTTDSTRGRIIVRFPRKSGDTTSSAGEALLELGEMALLTFKDPTGAVVLEGKDVAKSSPAVDTQTQKPIVQLELTTVGATKFYDATARLVNQKISIYMDDTLISDPTVQEAIAGGTAMIENIGTVEEAVALANKINAGAMPFALQAISSSQISPTMGKEALNVMTLAGLVAFLLICVFMIVYYRLPGFIACFALLAQVVGILLAISIPQQTLTLQGIAGIILSIGMGVDANVITAERIKEEINTGCSLQTALNNGFNRAFSSVFDGNVTVAIAAIVLMIFGSGSMLSFGYSILTGVILNGLTGVTASRLMIGSLSQYQSLKSAWLYGGKRVKA
jgi:preprotein translocase subunit SecD